MKVDEILALATPRKGRKRLGRGDGSGLGKTSGRGHKGYGARSGAKKRLGYEGGQTPQISRVPKRGFNNANYRTVFQVVNLDALQERFDDGATVNAETLVEVGLIHDADKPVKILGQGELSKKLTVTAEKLSASAAAKITAAGGTVEGTVSEGRDTPAGEVPVEEAPAKSGDAQADANDKADSETTEEKDDKTTD
jgi:large subunit ribosomal protein L15